MHIYLSVRTIFFLFNFLCGFKEKAILVYELYNSLKKLFLTTAMMSEDDAEYCVGNYMRVVDLTQFSYSVTNFVKVRR